VAHRIGIDAGDRANVGWIGRADDGAHCGPLAAWARRLKRSGRGSQRKGPGNRRGLRHFAGRAWLTGRAVRTGAGAA
jgi:hypothetical protein